MILTPQQEADILLAEHQAMKRSSDRRHAARMALDDARDQAILAVDEYYNGDHAWAERWLLNAYQANKPALVRPDYWDGERS